MLNLPVEIESQAIEFNPLIAVVDDGRKTLALTPVSAFTERADPQGSHNASEGPRRRIGGGEATRNKG